MKKLLLSVVATMLVLCCVCGNALAYSNKYYSIDVSNKFKKSQDNGTTTSFTLGSTIQLAVSAIDRDDKEEESDLVEGILNGKKDMDEFVDYLLDQNPNFTESNIVETDITSISKNKYDAVHAKMKQKSSGNTAIYHVYLMLTDDHIFMITLVSLNDEETLESSDVQDAIDSFTVTNEDVYSASKKSKKSDKDDDDNKTKLIIIIAASAILVVLILGIVIACVVRKKN